MTFVSLGNYIVSRYYLGAYPQRRSTRAAAPSRLRVNGATGPEMTLQNLDYQVLSTFRRDLRRFLAVSEELAQGQGIPPQQHQAILAIKGRPEQSLSIGDLAEALLIKPNTAVELAARLVEADLVVRRPAPRDRRRILLSLTPKADEILAHLSQAHLHELRRLEPAMRDLLDRLHQETAGGGG